VHTLREKLEQSSRFVVGCELVSVRGSMTARGAIKVRDFANELVACPDVDWISITDNAGGNPQLAPQALGKPMLYAGKEVVIHLTCKDLNRNGLESEAWLLNSEGFHNVLAMTGDYPLTGSGGTAKPVFDIDSVGLISMLSAMNDGFQPRETRAGRTPERLAPTSFFIGAVTTNYKRHEGEVMPQYRKLEKKVAAGARFIINQVGYDARKAHELRLYMDHHAMPGTPLIGNVYVLNPVVARLFHDARIPGIVVSPELLRLAEAQGASPDRGKAFFLEFAAKQIAIFKGLGYRGAYLGGVHGFDAIARILTIERSFAPDDWKQFAREIAFSRDDEFFFYGKDPATGLADASTRDRTAPPVHAHAGVVYRLSKWTHAHMFEPGHAISRWGASVSAHARDPRQGPALLRVVERASKAALFDCRDCGDCSLPEIAYLCPESQCAKNQRNGPCGGTRDGQCEVDGFGDCIWLRAYERRAHDGDADHLLDHAPVVQDQGLRGTSSWANHWLGRDHTSRPAEPATAADPPAAPPLALEGRQPTTATK
jgi:methylenetetrahydrofolate reductase (NADPH)